VLRERYPRARVIAVYIAEAHAADEWPICSTRCAGPGNSVRRPRTLDERRVTAARAVEALGLGTELLVDGIDDAFCNCFAAWPIRLFGLRAGRVDLVCEPRGGMYDIGELDRWLTAVADEDGRCAEVPEEVLRVARRTGHGRN